MHAIGFLLVLGIGILAYSGRKQKNSENKVPESSSGPTFDQVES